MQQLFGTLFLLDCTVFIVDLFNFKWFWHINLVKQINRYTFTIINNDDDNNNNNNNNRVTIQFTERVNKLESRIGKYFLKNLVFAKLRLKHISLHHLGSISSTCLRAAFTRTDPESAKSCLSWLSFLCFWDLRM